MANSDYLELQGLIDAAKTSPTGTVTISRNYTIDQPLIIHNWDSGSNKYGQVSITLQGYATMWDNGSRSVIRTTFNDAPALCIQVGKGCLIKGINFQGHSIGRDSRYSPQVGIAIDPFSGNIPPDGGYPTLTSWYRGPQVRSGTTGVRIEDCTFNNFLGGIITSPNGYTQNAELLTYQNIRLSNVKYGFIGCQAQEKMNRIINVGAWGQTEYVFCFNMYGAQQPGNWYIEGVNIAGSVKNIINRYSSGWGPLFMKNVFAEQITSIGTWGGGSGDVFSESLINLKFPSELGYYPERSLLANDLTIKDVNIRYYGNTKAPILLYGATSVTGGQLYLPPITDKYGWSTGKIGYVIDQPFKYSSGSVVNNKATIELNAGQTMPSASSHIIFMQMQDWSYLGQGEIESVSGSFATIRYISPSITNLTNYRMGVYRKI